MAEEMKNLLKKAAIISAAALLFAAIPFRACCELPARSETATLRITPTRKSVTQRQVRLRMLGSGQFKKAPPLGPGRKVRAALVMDFSDGPDIPFIINLRENKIFLDYNANYDLTDDGSNVYEGKKDRNWRAFKNVIIPLKNGDLEMNCRTNLILGKNRNGSYNCWLQNKSVWRGFITLNGKKTMVVLCDDFDLEITPGAGNDCFALFDPDENDWQEKLYGLLKGFYITNAPRRLFYHDAAFELEYEIRARKSNPSLQFTAEVIDVPLAEIELTGEHIKRLRFKGDFSALYDKPGKKITIPAGSYDGPYVLLWGGVPGVYAYASYFRSHRLAPESRKTIEAGGPLKHHVSCRFTLDHLMMRYNLVGADNYPYNIHREKEIGPPRFRIIKGNDIRHSGAFEYG